MNTHKGSLGVASVVYISDEGWSKLENVMSCAKKSNVTLIRRRSNWTSWKFKGLKSLIGSRWNPWSKCVMMNDWQRWNWLRFAISVFKFLMHPDPP